MQNCFFPTTSGPTFRLTDSSNLSSGLSCATDVSARQPHSELAIVLRVCQAASTPCEPPYAQLEYGGKRLAHEKQQL
jgi:hypothetical protein